MKQQMACSDRFFGAAELDPQKAGLDDVVIRSHHGGILRSEAQKYDPHVELKKGDMFILVQISFNPEILIKSKHVSDHDLQAFQQGIEFISRNHDIFLKHYMDTDFSFDDEDFFQALRERGEYG